MIGKKRAQISEIAGNLSQHRDRRARARAQVIDIYRKTASPSSDRACYACKRGAVTWLVSRGNNCLQTIARSLLKIIRERLSCGIGNLIHTPALKDTMQHHPARTFVATFFWLSVCVVALLLVVANASAQPTSATQAKQAALMGFDEARHLLNRSSFAAQTNEIDDYAKLTREQAVDRLLSETRRTAAYPAPTWTAKYERVYRPDMTPEQRMQANRRELVERGLEIRTWWVAEMLSTPSPLTEKMTLFWHNHFATSQQKVRSAALMYRQNVLLRNYATGNFGAMLREVSKDPAMLIYLDGAQNRKGAPNENFAREVMELFTLGEGNYSEKDIKEVARAFTGWSIDTDAGEFRFRRAAHDDGSKTVFGKEGKFNGDDIVTLLLQQPATSEFIVSKLWRELVSPEPDAAVVKQLAATWRAANYEIKPLLRAMFLSEAFWRSANRGVLVKSPVDLVIGSLRQFRFAVEDPAPFAVILRQLGQDLFNPPNVKGWPVGDAWLNTTTLLARKGFLNRLFRMDEMVKPATAVATQSDKADAPDVNSVGNMMAQPASAPTQSTAQLMDQDMAGQGRQRAQMRLAARGTGAQDGGAINVGNLPPFGVSNQLRGQYSFNAEQWFMQYPQQKLAAQPMANDPTLQADVRLLAQGDERVWHTVLAGPPVQASKDVPRNLAGLRTLALDPMYQLK